MRFLISVEILHEYAAVETRFKDCLFTSFAQTRMRTQLAALPEPARFKRSPWHDPVGRINPR